MIPQLAAATATGGNLIRLLISLTSLSKGSRLKRIITFRRPAGFNNDKNGENTLPAAIDCESCQNVIFDSVIVRHTSTSGLQIASTSGNSGPPGIERPDSEFSALRYRLRRNPYRTSSSGIGPAANVVQFITVQNNIVQGYSRVFANGEGLAQGNGHDITYLHNDITDGYHAGISICDLGCPSAGFAANGVNITTQYNHIWNVIQGITSDGGRCTITPAPRAEAAPAIRF